MGVVPEIFACAGEGQRHTGTDIARFDWRGRNRYLGKMCAGVSVGRRYDAVSVFPPGALFLRRPSHPNIRTRF